MRFKATDVFDYYKPSPCPRRVALKARGEPEQATDTPFATLIRDLGSRHETAHLATFADILDLSPFKDQPLERERLTLAAIHEGRRAIYQPRFRATFRLDGEKCELIGEPDFLVHAGTGRDYVIRDSKLARNIESDRHAGIPLQLQIYGYLYERATGTPPARLEVHNGADEILPLAYQGEAAVLALLRQQMKLRQSSPDVYEPVGWSKCDGCGFEDRCWSIAEASQDVSMLPVVDQRRARALHAAGITAIRDVPAAIEDPAHRALFYEGKKKPTLRSSAVSLLRSAESFLGEKPIVIERPVLPTAYAVLDLEGLPIAVDELDKTYLWGLQVFGDRPSPYLCAEAGFGAEGDREGWTGFLDLAGRLFDQYGPSLPIVHWGSYEKGRLALYERRYGGDGTLDVVRRNLVDLLGVVRSSVVLPLLSYGLKVVEKHVRFERKLPEANGAWSIVRYIEATETANVAERSGILGEIRAYNAEDLAATSAVMEWLRETLKNSAA